MVRVCLEYGRTGLVPEKLILSFATNSAEGEESKAQERDKTLKKIPLLRKQIKRKLLVRGLQLL